MRGTSSEETMNLRDVLRIIRKRLWLILIITFAGTLISGIVSVYYIKPVYETQISIVIGKTLNSKQQPQYDYSDIMKYQNLVKTYAEIAQSRSVAQKTAEKLGISDTITPEKIQDETTVVPKEETQIIDIKYRDGNPESSKDTLEVLAATFIEEASHIFPDGNVQILDEAVVPEAPISPNKILNIIVAFFIGLMLSFGLSFIIEYYDNTIKTEEDIEKYIGLPVIGVIPRT